MGAMPLPDPSGTAYAGDPQAVSAAIRLAFPEADLTLDSLEGVGLADLLEFP